MDIKAIVEEAKEAAKKATQDFINVHGEPFYCGYAWVEMRVERTNSPLAKELIAAGFKKHDMKAKTLMYWNPSGHNTQSIDAKSWGAAAFVDVLFKHGLSALAYDRLD